MVRNVVSLPGRTKGHFQEQGPHGTVSGETFTCPHCSGIEVVDRSQAIHVCEHCHAPVCSAFECRRVCYPFEKKLDDLARANARAASRGSILRAAGIAS